jgi:hypothetical protein
LGTLSLDRGIGFKRTEQSKYGLTQEEQEQEQEQEQEEDDNNDDKWRTLQKEEVRIYTSHSIDKGPVDKSRKL